MMKRSLSVEDLFETSGSDDVDLTEDTQSPQSPPLPTTKKRCSTLDVVSTNSQLEKPSFPEKDMTGFVQKGSTEPLERIRGHELSDSDDSMQSRRSVKSEKCRDSREPPFKHISLEHSHGKRRVCQYGKQCYRKNPDHFKEFIHPGGSLYLDSTVASSSSSSKKQQPDSEVTSCSGVQSKMADCHDNARSRVSKSLEESDSFSFFLTKVQGINCTYNYKGAIGIKDILSQNLGNLQKSAQFNFKIDVPWLISRYPEEFRNRPLLIVHGAKGEEKVALQEEASRYDNVRLCQAPLDIAYGTHHTKMMLLLYNNGLRVIIHTANLVDGDWRQKTQGVWMSPLFPKLSTKESAAGDSSTHFKQDLVEYLTAYRQKSLDEWISTIQQSDMSAAKVVLIGSIPGRYIGDEKNRFGHLKLRKVLQKSGPEALLVSDWPVIGQFSSVGSLGASSDAWLTSEWLTSLSSSKGSLSGKAKLQLVYPSKENVRHSLEGYPAGAALPYSIRTATRQPYFTSYLHQWRSDCRGRTRASPHIKTYTRASNDGTQIAWFLVTSANMSKAAWGSLEKNGAQLLVRSYELGVLFLPEHFGVRSFTICRPTSDEQAVKRNGLPFPFPFDLPPVPYGKDDRPWIWDIAYLDKPDSNGNVWSPS